MVVSTTFESVDIAMSLTGASSSVLRADSSGFMFTSSGFTALCSSVVSRSFSMTSWSPTVCGGVAGSGLGLGGAVGAVTTVSAVGRDDTRSLILSTFGAIAGARMIDGGTAVAGA